MPQTLRRYRIHFIILVLSLVIGALTAIHLGQDLNWDLLNYHYYVPYAFLHHRFAFDIAPAQLQSYGNPLIDLYSYALISHLRPIAAGSLLGALQGLNIWLIFEIALVLLRRTIPIARWRAGVALFVAVLSFFGAANLSEVGNSMGDNLTAILVVAGVWLLLLSFDYKRKARWLRIGAYFAIGLAVGLKLTNLMYGVALIAAGLAIAGSWKVKLKESVWHVGSFAAGVLLLGGFWYVRMWQQLKNPIFPYYNTVFHSPYYLPSNFIDPRWLVKSPEQAILEPFYFLRHSTSLVASEIHFRDPRLALVYLSFVALVGFALVPKFAFKKPALPRWSRAHTCFWIFFIISYVIWLDKFGYYRYLMPLELLSLVAVMTAAVTLIKNKKLAIGTLAIILIATTFLTSPINWGRAAHWQPTYFGVQATATHIGMHSTVLIAGDDPFGFLVPFFPAQDRFVRVQDNMAFPDSGQPPAEISLVKKTIATDEAQHKTFYALESVEGQAVQLGGLSFYGFQNKTCQTLTSQIHDTIGGETYLICSLKPLT